MAKTDDPAKENPSEPPKPARASLTTEQAWGLVPRIRSAAPWERSPQGKIVKGLEVLGVDPATGDNGAAIRVEGPKGFARLTDGGEIEALLATFKK